MKFRIDDLHVRGIAAAMPANVLELRDLAPDYGESEVERIIASTGVEAVRVAPPTVTASDLCELAARRLLDELQVAPSQVDAIVFVSQTPDYILPTTSSCLQQRLGLSQDVAVFDIPSGCTGYIYGLFQAALLIHTGVFQQVLVCAGDTITRHIHPQDRALRMVLGDAGSATLVSRGSGPASFAIHSDGSGAESLIIPAGGSRRPSCADTARVMEDAAGNKRSADNIFMNGAEIMSFALREVPKVIDEVLALAGWEKDSVGFYGLHQANKFMIDYLAKKCRLPKGSAPVSIRRTGNGGPASIPLLMAVARDQLPPEQRMRSVLCGFGVGLSWGACALELSGTVVLPPLEL